MENIPLQPHNSSDADALKEDKKTNTKKKIVLYPSAIAILAALEKKNKLT